MDENITPSCKLFYCRIIGLRFGIMIWYIAKKILHREDSTSDRNKKNTLYVWFRCGRGKNKTYGSRFTQYVCAKIPQLTGKV